MNVHELSREQIDELKQSYLTEKMEAEGESPSYGELADAPQDITDEEIFERYEGTEFSNDDFICSCENLASKSFETYIMEGSRGMFLHINADPSGDGTWFVWTPSVFEAYYHDLDQLQEIARCEFSDYTEGYPKFHKVRFSFEKIETV